MKNLVAGIIKNGEGILTQAKHTCQELVDQQQLKMQEWMEATDYILSLLIV